MKKVYNIFLKVLIRFFIFYYMIKKYKYEKLFLVYNYNRVNEIQTIEEILKQIKM